LGQNSLIINPKQTHQSNIQDIIQRFKKFLLPNTNLNTLIVTSGKFEQSLTETVVNLSLITPQGKNYLIREDFMKQFTLDI